MGVVSVEMIDSLGTEGGIQGGSQISSLGDLGEGGDISLKKGDRKRSTLRQKENTKFSLGRVEL